MIYNTYMPYKDPAKKHANDQKRRERNRRLGQCGCGRPARPDRTTCVACADAMYNYVRRGKLAQSGMTPEAYDTTWLKQDGLCAICHQPETSLGTGGKPKLLASDHNHNTGQARGLLCYRCNSALGLFDDDSERMIAAAVYLQEWEVAG